MEKTSNSSGDSSAVSTSNNHHYLRQLNKLSHKITKPSSSSSSSISAASSAVNREIDFPPPQSQNLHQHQPPVYNINKNDFRDVVQKLTGSPSHERISAPPQQPTKPQQNHSSSSTRLHRIRPPPLAHVINRPPSLLNNAHVNPNWNHHNNGGFNGFVPRPNAPLSPLPPLPPVHAAAESPVSSYMRYLQNSMFAIDSNRKEFSPLAPLVSPRWYQQQQENAPPLPPPTTTTMMTAPPLPSNSPKSPYGLLSPSVLLSPTSGQLGFPVSPTTVALPSPK